MIKGILIFTALNTFAIIYLLFFNDSHQIKNRSEQYSNNDTPNTEFPHEEGLQGTHITAEEQAKEKAELMAVIKQATVIIRISHTINDSSVTARITEIISIGNDIKFDLKVGDEYKGASRNEKPDSVIGEGAIVFLKGQAPTFDRSLNIHSGRISGYQDMKLEDFITLIKTKMQNKSCYTTSYPRKVL